MIIAPDEGRIPWWRLLWSLLAALLIGVVGIIALMTDMNNPGPLHVAIELVSVPFVRPTYYLLGQTSATAISVAALASFACGGSSSSSSWSGTCGGAMRPGPPNPRLQRTRLRAPLSRKPLGDTE